VTNVRTIADALNQNKIIMHMLVEVDKLLRALWKPDRAIQHTCSTGKAEVATSDGKFA